jgi:hypothetical protein
MAAKILQPARMQVIWSESGWSKLSIRYSMAHVFWGFLNATP